MLSKEISRIFYDATSVAATLLRCDIVHRRNAGVAYNALFRYDDATQRINGASLIEVNEYIFYAGYPQYVSLHQEILSDLLDVAGSSSWNYEQPEDNHPVRRTTGDGDGIRFTTLIQGQEYPPISWNKDPDFVYSIQALLDTPSITSEFERMHRQLKTDLMCHAADPAAQAAGSTALVFGLNPPASFCTIMPSPRGQAGGAACRCRRHPSLTQLPAGIHRAVTYHLFILCCCEV
ncbi:unnamed protein product, partial [Brenthis ino]